MSAQNGFAFEREVEKGTAVTAFLCASLNRSPAGWAVKNQARVKVYSGSPGGLPVFRAIAVSETDLQVFGAAAVDLRAYKTFGLKRRKHAAQLGPVDGKLRAQLLIGHTPREILQERLWVDPKFGLWVRHR
jgi:hypothetical protein